MICAPALTCSGVPGSSGRRYRAAPLKAGYVVECEIENIGVLRNHVVAPNTIPSYTERNP